MYYAQKKFDEAVLINNDSMYNIALNGDDLIWRNQCSKLSSLLLWNYVFKDE